MNKMFNSKCIAFIELLWAWEARYTEFTIAKNKMKHDNPYKIARTFSTSIQVT